MVSVKVVVVSDSHGYNHILHEIVEAHPDADYFLHLGDLEGNPENFPMYHIVKGNMDRNIEQEELVIEIGSYRIFMTHSNHYNYFNRYYQLADRAKELDCQIALYGHTHIPHFKIIDNIIIFNPGSVSEGRSELLETYGILYLEDDSFQYEFVSV